jgi:hypothetical protein
MRRISQPPASEGQRFSTEATARGFSTRIQLPAYGMCRIFQLPASEGRRFSTEATARGFSTRIQLPACGMRRIFQLPVSGGTGAVHGASASSSSFRFHRHRPGRSAALCCQRLARLCRSVQDRSQKLRLGRPSSPSPSQVLPGVGGTGTGFSVATASPPLFDFEGRDWGSSLVGYSGSSTLLISSPALRVPRHGSLPS